MEFELRIIDLRWHSGEKDDPDDLCLRGKVFVRIGDEVIDDGVSHDGWCVSAGAYRLLESLYGDYKYDSEAYLEHLLPCCGHWVIVDEKTDKLNIIGCINGLDWAITHKDSAVILTTDSNTQVSIPFDEYQKIIYNFADEIKAFYDQCSPKKTFYWDFEEHVYRKFWENWDEMRNGRYPSI